MGQKEAVKIERIALGIGKRGAFVQKWIVQQVGVLRSFEPLMATTQHLAKGGIKVWPDK